MTAKQARGLRNNNPGNIDYRPENKWQGQVGIETDVPAGVKPRFAKFKSIEYGIRAIAVLCINYFDKNGCDTVGKVIGRWAPPSENNTTAYARQVAKDVSQALGYDVSTTQYIDLHDYCTLRAVVCGIIEHENALTDYKQAVSDAQVDKALTLAGVEPPKKPLSQTKTMKNAATLGTVGAGGVVAGLSKLVEDHADTAATAVPIIGETAAVVEDHYTGLFILFGIIVISCAVYMAYNRWKDRKEGVR